MFTLPKLPYAFDALEPYIDAKTMEIHYTKHHQKYIDDLNSALQNHPELQTKSLEELLRMLDTLPEPLRTAVRNNGGGHYNHSLFWEFMNARGGDPRGKIEEALKKTFGNFEVFKEEFSNAAKSRFGSGWAWLSLNKQGNLIIHSTANQDSPISETLVPIMGLDVWEHAYYLKYQNKRVDYIAAWWNVINWDMIEERYRSFLG